MTILDNLTDLEREQLRYIVERVPEWPQDTKCLWVSSVGYIHKGHDVLGGGIFDNALGIDWPTLSPDFTRAQYDAMKAEIEAQEVPSIDYRAHCEALAGALENARAHVVAWQGEPHPYSCTIHKAVVAQIDEALTRWKEEGK